MNESLILSEKQDKSFSVPLILLSKIILLYQALCLAMDKEFAALLPLCLSLFLIALFFKFDKAIALILFSINTLVLFLPYRFIGFNMLEWSLIVLLVVVIGVDLVKSAPISKKYILPYKKEFYMIFISLLLSMGYTFLEGRYPIRGLGHGLRFLLYFAPFYLLLNYLKTSNFKRTIDAYLLSGVIFVVLLYFCLIVLKVGLNEPNRLSLNGMFASNFVAGYMEIFFPLAFVLFLGSKTPMRKYTYLALSLLFLTTLLLTYSKGATITVLVVLIYCLWRYFSLRMFVIVSAVAACFIPMILAGFQERLNLNNIGELLSAYTRVELYKSAAKMLAEHYFIIGYGINAFAQNKFSFGFPIYLDYLRVMSPHNLYLELFIGLGIVGFVAFMVFIVKIVWQLKYAKTERLGHVKYGLLLSILSYFIHNLVDCSIIVSSSSIALFSLLAFAEYFKSNVNELERENNGAIVSTKSSR